MEAINLRTAGSILVPRLLPANICRFITHGLMVKSALQTPETDAQVPAAPSFYADNLTECLLERIWPVVESATGTELIPTYSYARVYHNGDVLEPHTDRESCEVSVTLQLGRSHHYSWPIYMGDRRYDLAEGDAIIYSGCDVKHWREVCAGPGNYYSAQVFLHYVRATGPYAEHATDKRFTHNPFVRNRISDMESK